MMVLGILESWLKQQLSAEEGSPLKFVSKMKTGAPLSPLKFSFLGLCVSWDSSQPMLKPRQIDEQLKLFFS